MLSDQKKGVSVYIIELSSDSIVKKDDKKFSPALFSAIGEWKRKEGHGQQRMIITRQCIGDAKEYCAGRKRFVAESSANGLARPADDEPATSQYYI